MAKRDENGKFLKGESPNPKGRPKGSKNRLTKDIRTSLKDIVFHELASLPEALSELPPKERLEALSKLLPYVLPKVDSIVYNKDEPMNEYAGWGW